ncbi:hypothetical transcript [Echinococcus multilocularis]|uniref:Hypothetical transcript n=1 Tax=Echinococcus multilocularis TaxID=6211 RepID=A0A068Y207_ECHMU|nr:hypothetical transcript [Echinococcus multilocularis]
MDAVCWLPELVPLGCVAPLDAVADTAAVSLTAGRPVSSPLLQPMPSLLLTAPSVPPKEYHDVLSSFSRLALLSSCPMSGWQRTCGAFLQEEKNGEHSDPLPVVKTYKSKLRVRLFAESLSTFTETLD